MIPNSSVYKYYYVFSNFSHYKDFFCMRDKVVGLLLFFLKNSSFISLTGRKEAPMLRSINFPHPINPPGKNPVNKNGVVYVDLLYRMMSEERHCVMLLMFVYGELSSKKNKQKNVHLLPPKKCVQF